MYTQVVSRIYLFPPLKTVNECWALKTFTACLCFRFCSRNSARPKAVLFFFHLQSVQCSQHLQQLLANLALGVPPFVKQMVDPISLPTLILPYLLEIISPSLRPVSG